VGPSDPERRPEGLSNFASGYQKAAPYMGASTALVVAVALFTWLGHWLDVRLRNEIPWLTVVGALVGMVGGFVSFFKTVLGSTRTKQK
jgi:F0F1-type ATP synthase assembly protein I